MKEYPLTTRITFIAVFAALLTAGTEAATYQYMARTGAPVPRPGSVVAAGITWNCWGNQCTTSGPWPAPGVAACQALARQVGPITSYGHKGRMLNPEELKECNAGAAAKPVPGLPLRPALGTKPQPAKDAAAAPARFTPLTIRTAALRITGTGASAPVGAGFSPVTIRTNALSITGTGSSAAVGSGFTPVTIRTAPLILTGTGSL